ncbi:hypothetical protein ACWC2M_12805 [Streptomyces sp. NPDC001761]
MTVDGHVRGLDRWIAPQNGTPGMPLVMIESGEIAHARTRTELLAALTTVLDAGRAAGDQRRDLGAEDIAACLIGLPGPNMMPTPVACRTSRRTPCTPPPGPPERL